MKDNIYSYGTRSFPLGSLINSEADGMIFTNGGPCKICQITFEKGFVALPAGHGIVLVDEGAIDVEYVKVGDMAQTVNNDILEVKQMVWRDGVKINIPRDSFALNGVLVSSKPSKRQPKVAAPVVERTESSGYNTPPSTITPAVIVTPVPTKPDYYERREKKTQRIQPWIKG